MRLPHPPPAGPKRLAVAALLLMLGACSAESTVSTGTEQPDEDPSASPSPSSSPPSSSTTRPVIDGPLSRCGPVPERVAGAPFRHQVLRDPAVGTIPSAAIGRGRTAVILLHQTDGDGLCGWLPFARDLAGERGVSALAIDLCGYGEADCRKPPAGQQADADQTDAVALAVRHARERLGARKVVVVGASMGGSIALMSAATLPDVDAAVDLSGPVTWPGMELVEEGRALDVPVLASTATSEGKAEVRGTRKIVAHAPPGSTFLSAQGGHGYTLLNDADGLPLPMNARVRGWILDITR